MQFSRVDFSSIGPPSQKLWLNIIFAWFPPLKLQWGNRAKMILGHTFWLGTPIDIKSTHLNCILQDLFRDTPLDHILRAQICTQICIFGIFGHIWHIWARIWAPQIWSSGVSLKRSCKMQFTRVGLAHGNYLISNKNMTFSHQILHKSSKTSPDPIKWLFLAMYLPKK